MDDEFVAAVKERIEGVETQIDRLSLENRELDIRLTKLEEDK